MYWTDSSSPLEPRERGLRFIGTQNLDVLEEARCVYCVQRLLRRVDRGGAGEERSGEKGERDVDESFMESRP